MNDFIVTIHPDVGIERFVVFVQTLAVDFEASAFVNRDVSPVQCLGWSDSAAVGNSEGECDFTWVRTSHGVAP
ncbi:hypothetical protein D3C86_1796430 [compost metagenome]